MGTADKSAAGGDWRHDNFIGTDHFHQHTDAGDVSDRIDTADFMEMNLLNRFIMDIAFGFRDQTVDSQHIRFDLIGHIEFRDHLFDIREGCVMVVMVMSVLMVMVMVSMFMIMVVLMIFVMFMLMMMFMVMVFMIVMMVFMIFIVIVMMFMVMVFMIMMMVFMIFIVIVMMCMVMVFMIMMVMFMRDVFADFLFAVNNDRHVGPFDAAFE